MSSAVAVTDTHALIWASQGRLKKLGRRAAAHFQRTDRGEAAVYVPALVLVEVSELHHLGRITLPMPFSHWVDRLVSSRRYLVADLTADVVVHAGDLFDIPERGDRLIAATARALDLPLITRHADITACARVERLWD